MKFLLFIIGLVAITVGSTYFVAPQFREYHEAKLKQKVEEEIAEAGYMQTEVKMSHLHAERVDVLRIPKAGETKEGVKKDVVKLVRAVYGATVEPEDVYVNFTNAPTPKPKEVDSVSDSLIGSLAADVLGESVLENMGAEKPASADSGDIELVPNLAGVGGVAPEDIEPIFESSEFYVEWNERKNVVQVNGKMSNQSEKDALLSIVRERFHGAEIIDTVIVDEESIAAPTGEFQVDKILPIFTDACVGAGSLSVVDDPMVIKVNGLLKSKTNFMRLEKRLDAIVVEPATLVNKAMYHADFTIEKDDETNEVILSGFANRNDSVNLSSYIKRYTQDTQGALNESSKYDFKSVIEQDERAEGYVWTDADQQVLDGHLKNSIRGKLFYENDLLVKLTGVSDDQAYIDGLVAKYKDSATSVKMEHSSQIASDDRAVVVEEAVDSNLSNTSAARPTVQTAKTEKEIKAAAKLRTELKDYKIYFGSGSKDVAAKYDDLIQAIATVIVRSEDKKSVIVIGGFADYTGDAEQNAKLSRERASSVQVKLVELGVPIKRTVVEFFGAEGADVEKSLSRRVEIRVR